MEKERILLQQNKNNILVINISEKGNLVLSRGSYFTWYNENELEASKKRAKQSIAISYKKGGSDYDACVIWNRFSRKLKNGELPGGKRIMAWNSTIISQDGTIYTIRKNKIRKVAYKKANDWQHRYETLNVLNFLMECHLDTEQKIKMCDWLMVLINKYVSRQLPIYNVAFGIDGEEKFNKLLDYLKIYRDISFTNLVSYKKAIGSFENLWQNNWAIYHNLKVTDNFNITDKNCLNNIIKWSSEKGEDFRLYGGADSRIDHYTKWLREKYRNTNVNVDVLLMNRLLKNNYNFDCFEGIYSLEEYYNDPRFAALIPNNLHKLDFKELEEQTNLIHRDIKRIIENMPFNIPNAEQYSMLVEDYQFKVAEDSATLGWLGNICHNCVGGYSRKVRRGDAIILYGQNKNNTICIEVDPKTNRVIQCLNPYNKRVNIDDLKKCLMYFKTLGINHNGWCVEEKVIKEDIFDETTGELIDMGKTIYIDLETGKEVRGRASFWYVND